MCSHYSTTRCSHLVCPVRPSNLEVQADEEAWENVVDAPDALDSEARDAVNLDDAADGDSGDVARRPVGIPEPFEPTPLQRAQHNLTHYPYANWCEHCVRARRPNSHHRYSPSSSVRSIPVFVIDYCFPRDSRDETTTTCAVGKLYPSRTPFALVVDEKGANDELAVKLLANLFRENGVKKLVYKSDQEHSVKCYVDEALKQAGASGEVDDEAVLAAVPEYSAVGESPSNGKAERTVQIIEDQVRTLKDALETRLEARLPCHHPVMRWLVRHCATIIGRFSVNPDVQTPYQSLHGKRAPDKMVEFGERVYYWIPRKMRYKLDMKWKVGIMLGVVNSSNEYYVGTASGNVVKSRSVVRCVASKRWNADLVQRIVGIPGDMNKSNEPDIANEVESSADPHANREADRALGADGMEEDENFKKLDVSIRLTVKDLKTYGYSPACPRCIDLQAGRVRSNKHHTVGCRKRLYKALFDNNDVKYQNHKYLFETKAAPREDSGARGSQEAPTDDLQHREPFEVQPEARPHAPRANSQNEPNQSAQEWNFMDDLGNSEALDADEQAFNAGYDDLDDTEMEDTTGLEEHMVDSFVLAGADRTDAIIHVKSLMRTSSKQTKLMTTFMEIFGGGAICKEANGPRRNLNLRGLSSMDLRTSKPNGEPWNFDLREDRKLAREMIDKEEPTWLIGSPPCTAFSLWTVAMNYPKAPDQEAVKEAIARGRRHLRFCTSLYRKQMKAGRHFVHEHPATALSWKDSHVMSLAKDPLVHVVVADQCQYGFTSPSPEGEQLPALKPTRFMTSSQLMANRLSLRCKRDHVHQQLVGGRCKDAAFYPLGLIKALLMGMRDQADYEGSLGHLRSESRKVINSVSDSAGMIPSENGIDATSLLSSAVPYTSGKNCIIAYKPENFKDRYVDEYTGEVLDPTQIKAAIIDELDYFNSKVWQIEHVSDMYGKSDYVRTRSRWVMCNKGDADNPDCRARLVSCEINKHKGDKPAEFMASTPPLEAQRIMFDRFVSERTRTVDGKQEPLRMSFVDIRKAYFNGIPRRDVYMDFPKEMGLGKEWVAKQVRCVYGTRDAGSIWEDCYRDALEAMEFVSGLASPCLFFHPVRNISIVVHGDDFNALAVKAELDWYETELATHFEIKIRGRMGPGGECKQIKILNRILTLTEDGLEHEADPRHVDLLASSMALSAANSVSTPGVKDPEADYSATKQDESQ